MTPLPQPEALLQRHGDAFYRIATLLTARPADAERLLESALRSAPPELLSEQHVYAALLRAPVSRRQPAWADPAVDGGVLARLGRLPILERMIVGLTLLRGLDATAIAQALDREPADIARIFRAAVQQVAAEAPTTRTQIDPAMAPPRCRPTRQALAQGDPAALDDPDIRGHLALCPDCRAAQHRWADMIERVDLRLREAFRTVRLPDGFAERLRPANRATPPLHKLAMYLSVPLAVAVVIALLVLPYRNASGTAPTAAAPTDARELVNRAIATLYQPASDGGVWHGMWQIRWDFSNRTFALLNADAWVDAERGQRRLQLVHQAGGGPYEFAMGDGSERFWYATTDLYGGSIYPQQLRSTDPRQIEMALGPADQQAFYDARLESGAWGIARRYLDTASTAPLQSWGTQRDESGRVLSVIGYRGASPLGLPVGVPNNAVAEATMLLVIDSVSGRLHEIRELIGPAGGEQISRTVWRFLGEERLERGSEAEARAFNIGAAWNGTGTFARQFVAAGPATPLMPRSRLQQPTSAIDPANWPSLPAALPPGISDVYLFLRTDAGDRAPNQGVAVYQGEGRSLSIGYAQGFATESFTFAEGQAEQFRRAGKSIVMMPGLRQRYQVIVTASPPGSASGGPTYIITEGFTRDEVVSIVEQMQVPSLTALVSQWPVFRGRTTEASAVMPLLAALTPISSRQPSFLRVAAYARHGTAQDTLADPYHGPLFLWPETSEWEIWRTAGGGTASVQRVSGPGLPGRVTPTQAGALFPWERRVLELMDCSDVQTETRPDGGMIISRTHPDWSNPTLEPCQFQSYVRAFLLTADGGNAMATLDPPFVGDLRGQPLTTRVRIGADGALEQVDVRVGTGPDGLMVESYMVLERQTDQGAPIITDDRVDGRTLKPGEATSRFGQLWQPADMWQVRGTTATSSTLLYTESGDIGGGRRQRANDIDQLVTEGLAIRMVFAVYDRQGNALGTTTMIQGPRATLVPALQRQSRWESSSPETVMIGGQPVGAWRIDIMTRSWHILELGDTLVIAQSDGAFRRESIDNLVPVTGE